MSKLKEALESPEPAYKAPMYIEANRQVKRFVRSDLIKEGNKGFTPILPFMINDVVQNVRRLAT